MLPVFVVKVAQIAAGYVVGSVAADTLKAAEKGVKKIVVKAKEKGAQK